MIKHLKPRLMKGFVECGKSIRAVWKDGEDVTTFWGRVNCPKCQQLLKERSQ